MRSTVRSVPLFAVSGINIAKRIGDGKRTVFALVDLRHGNIILPATLDELARALVSMYDLLLQLQEEEETNNFLSETSTSFQRRKRSDKPTCQIDVDGMDAFMNFSDFFTFEKTEILKVAEKFKIDLVPLCEAPREYKEAAISAIALHSRQINGGGAPIDICPEADVFIAEISISSSVPISVA